MSETYEGDVSLEWDSYVQSAWYSSYPVGLCFSGPIRCQNTFRNWFRTTRNGVPLFFPHQCSYSDRKGFPLGENHPYGPQGLLECPWSEILPSVTLTKRYDPIWSHPGGCSTLHQVPVVVKSGKICPYVSVAVDGEKSNNSSCIVPWDCISNSHH